MLQPLSSARVLKWVDGFAKFLPPSPPGNCIARPIPVAAASAGARAHPSTRDKASPATRLPRRLARCSGDRLDQRWIVVFTFPTRADRPANHLIGRVGGEQRLQLPLVGRLLAEPCRPGLGREDHRHAVIHASQKMFHCVDPPLQPKGRCLGPGKAQLALHRPTRLRSQDGS